jgi:hypothetical protein
VARIDITPPAPSGTVADGSVTAAKLAPDVAPALAANAALRAAFVPQPTGKVALTSPLRRLLGLAASVKPSGSRAVATMASPPTVTWAHGTIKIDEACTTLGTPQKWFYSDGCLTGFGGVPSGTSTASYLAYMFLSKWQSPANGVIPNPEMWAVEAMVEDTAVSVMLYGTIANGLRFSVDGQYVDLNVPAVQPAGNNAVKLDFAGVRAARRIRVEGYSSNCSVFGFATTATGSVYRTSPDPFRLMVLGDSVAHGTGATWNGDSFCRAAADHLGVSDLWVSADGGTGFIAVGGGGKQNYVTRVADVLVAKPDLLVTHLSQNDVASTPAAVVTAVGQFLDGIRAQLPTLPILIFGKFWNDASLAASQAIESAVQAAVAARNDPFVRFVNTQVTTGTAPRVPISGTGSTTALAGTGNADWAFDGPTAHPSTEGHLWIGRFVAAQVKAAVAAWT